MAYHPDLSMASTEKTLHVGWLAKDQPFSRGKVEQDFSRKLLLCCRHRVRQTRGFHICPFCEQKQFGVPVEIEGKVVKLGSAEIEVVDGRANIYVAPDLIYHYVTQHEYLPPADFIAAVSWSQP
jgi:hypothetical protein